MPRTNGIEAVRCLRQLLPTAGIIILSASGGMFSEEETGSLGIVAIISTLSPRRCYSTFLPGDQLMFGGQHIDSSISFEVYKR
jgi:DNA-binding NarL/FixJ family response regulator